MTRTSTTLRFALLITIACGFLDSYTYLARGHVFANAQTGNVIFFALGIADRHWGQALFPDHATATTGSGKVACTTVP